MKPSSSAMHTMQTIKVRIASPIQENDLSDSLCIRHHIFPESLDSKASEWRQLPLLAQCIIDDYITKQALDKEFTIVKFRPYINLVSQKKKVDIIAAQLIAYLPQVRKTLVQLRSIYPVPTL